MPPFLDLTGLRFGYIVVLYKVGKNINGNYLWKCICDCGTEIIVPGNKLKTIKSCGCLRIESVKNATTKHGKSYSSEYASWKGMKQRCYNRKSSEYKNYGARGIKVCDRWLNSFENFLEDMGSKPGKNYSIERIDNNGNYEPSNCKWATNLEQSNNKRTCRYINVDGKVVTITELARKSGVSKSTLFTRLKRGASIEDLLTSQKKRRAI